MIISSREQIVPQETVLTVMTVPEEPAKIDKESGYAIIEPDVIRDDGIHWSKKVKEKVRRTCRFKTVLAVIIFLVVLVSIAVLRSIIRLENIHKILPDYSSDEADKTPTDVITQDEVAPETDAGSVVVPEAEVDNKDALEEKVDYQKLETSPTVSIDGPKIEIKWKSKLW